jgi:hypothetical protein
MAVDPFVAVSLSEQFRTSTVNCLIRTISTTYYARGMPRHDDDAITVPGRLRRRVSLQSIRLSTFPVDSEKTSGLTIAAVGASRHPAALVIIAEANHRQRNRQTD